MCVLCPHDWMYPLCTHTYGEVRTMHWMYWSDGYVGGVCVRVDRWRGFARNVHVFDNGLYMRRACPQGRTHTDKGKERTFLILALNPARSTRFIKHACKPHKNCCGSVSFWSLSFFCLLACFINLFWVRDLAPISETASMFFVCVR
jgi:hypothetical protein